MFFVSVASKGLRVHVSGLESTLAGISISVDSKETYIDQKALRRQRELVAGGSHTITHLIKYHKKSGVVKGILTCPTTIPDICDDTIIVLAHLRRITLRVRI